MSWSSAEKCMKWLQRAHLDSSGLEIGVGERDGGKLSGTDGGLDISDIL
jgi:hypothetical protein